MEAGTNTVSHSGPAMEKAPRVSVIIPNYNYARYLDERIQSVLSQTYRDFEVIILDDRSTDDSREVIERYRGNTQVSRIVYNEENSGSVFRQWRKGISLARGEYVWIAEADDVAEPTFLEKLIGAIGDDPSVAYAASDITFVDGNGEPFAVWGAPGITEVRKRDGRRFIREMLLYDNQVYNASAVLFRRDLALRVPDGYTRMRSAGDYLFWVELASLGAVVEVPERLDRYRRHRATVTANTESTAAVYRELRTIYNRIGELGLMPLVRRYSVVGMRLWRLRLLHAAAQPSMAEVLAGWRGAVRFPAFAEALFMAYATFVRMPIKKFSRTTRDIRPLR